MNFFCRLGNTKKQAQYMNRLLLNLISAFIPDKKKRRAFRDKHRKISTTARQLVELQDQVLRLRHIVESQISPEDVRPARGLDRAIQLLGVEVLQDIDRVCRKHNIRYWIDFGTLLGAVRHKGFIPWDDDLDISMLWEDYLRFQEVAHELEISDPIFDEGMWGRICHKDYTLRGGYWWGPNNPKLRAKVDIFPYHYLKDSWSREDAVEYIRSLSREKDARRIELEKLHGGDVPQNWAITQREFEEREAELISAVPTGRIFLSLHFHCQFLPESPPCVARIQDIFPLKEIEFEGHQFMAPAWPELWLCCVYGAWWRAKIFPQHFHFDNKTPEQLQPLMEHAKRLGCL